MRALALLGFALLLAVGLTVNGCGARMRPERPGVSWRTTP